MLSKLNVSYFSKLSFIVIVIDTSRLFLLLWLLTPNQLGICFAYLLIAQVAQYSYGWIHESLAVTIPLKSVLKNDNSITSLTQLCKKINWIIICIFIAVSIIFLYLVNDISLLYGSYALFLIPFRSYISFYLSLQRSFGYIVNVAQIEFWSAVCLFILQPMLIYQFGINGFWWALIIQQVLVFSFILFFRKTNFFTNNTNQKFLFKTSELFAKGSSIVLTSNIITPLVFIIKLFTIMNLTFNDLGYLTLPLLIIAKIHLIPLTFSKIFLPYSTYISNGQLNNDAKASYFKYQFFTSIILVVISLIIYFLMPYIINIFLIQYKGAIELILPSILVGFIYVIFFNYSLFQISIGNSMYATKKNIEVCIVFLLLIFIMQFFYNLGTLELMYILFASFILVFLKILISKDSYISQS